MTSRRSTNRNTPTLGYGDYLRFSQLAHELYGLNFPEKRRNDLGLGVHQAFATSPCANLDAYYTLLLDPVHGRVHRQQLVNTLTIGESHFFRDTGQFNALYKHVLPEIIKRRRSLRTLRIWSAGCAGGEEAYSIAIMLRELLPDVDDWAITILATDINTEALERAQKAAYSGWAYREPRAKHLRERYFQLEKNRYVLAPEVRKMVNFSQLNLVEDVYPAVRTNTTYMDLILCRNVSIYFDTETTERMIDRFYSALVDEGWLVIGHSEHSITTYHRFQARSFPDTIIYQRTGQPTELPDDWQWLKTSSHLPSPQSWDSQVYARDLGTVTQVPLVEEVLPAKAVPEPQQPTLLERAREYLEYGHSEQAYALLSDHVTKQTKDAASCALLCQASANLGDWQEAEGWCQLATHLDPLEPEPYYTLGLIFQHQERLQEAIVMMKKVVYLDSKSVRAYYSLANLYYENNKLPQALKALDNARGLLADCPDRTVVPGTGGITVSGLREAITQQQQQWNAEAADLLR